MEIKKVGILGAGTMGLGIAQTTAMAGYKTVLFDIQKYALDNAEVVITKNLDKGIEKGKVTEALKASTLENLTFTDHFDNLESDLVIEAALEKLDLKKSLFKNLEELNGAETILASNTSSIPITQIGAELKHPNRFLGIHFFNPAHIMKLVEIISGVATDPAVVQSILKFVESLGKVGVLAKDAPGFIVNRVARHFYVESLKVLEEGVADHKNIDSLIKSVGFKMGPFELMDLIGVDTNFAVTSSMYNAFHQDPKFRPNRIQEQKVVAGHHGRKSGKGFYDYEK